MVSTSEVSISVTIDDASRLEQLVEELSALADVRVEHDMAILCAVGDGLRRDPRLAKVHSDRSSISRCGWCRRPHRAGM